MPVLSPAAIAGYARNAGFSDQRSHRGVREDILAVAIALGESGGDTHAHNARPPDNSYGLWQINMIGGLGPARRAQFGISSNEQLFNPATNAKAAFMVFRDAGNSFRPWSVYINGTYLRYLSAAGQGARNPTAPPAGEAAGTEDTGAGFLSTITSGATWLRVAQFLGGGMLIVVALLMMGGRSVDDIVRLIPAGKALRAVRGK